MKRDYKAAPTNPKDFLSSHQRNLDDLESFENKRNETLFSHADILAPLHGYKCRIILDNSIKTSDLAEQLLSRKGEIGRLTSLERVKTIVYAHILNLSELVVSRSQAVSHVLDENISSLFRGKSTSSFRRNRISDKYPTVSDYPLIFNGYVALDSFKLLTVDQIKGLKTELKNFETELSNNENGASLFFSASIIDGGIFKTDVKKGFSLENPILSVGDFPLGVTPYASNPELTWKTMETYSRLKSEMTVLCNIEHYFLRRVDAQILLRDSLVIPKTDRDTFSPPTSSTKKPRFEAELDPVTFGGHHDRSGKNRTHRMTLRSNALTRGAAMANILRPEKIAPVSARSPTGWHKFGEWFLDRLVSPGSEPKEGANVQTDRSKRFDFFDRFRETSVGKIDHVPKWNEGDEDDDDPEKTDGLGPVLEELQGQH